MKELSELIQARRREPHVPHVVATVLRVEGSSYRRPGARMLMNIHGRVAGSISGGCLERAVIAEARRVLVEGGGPRLLAFDTTDGDDLALGASLGCQGRIWIGLEVLPAHQPWRLEDAVEEIRRGRKPAALVTRYRETGGPVFFEAHVFFKTEGDEAVRDVLELRKNSFVQHESGERSLVEWLAPPLALLLFGAGPDLMPMLRLAREMGHETTVINARAESFPDADQTKFAKPTQIGERICPDDRTAAVLMNHQYDTDRDTLAALLSFRLPYLALLGPKKRTERILKDLADAGHEVDPVLPWIHGPAGLDIGAETPEQIALAILAEIQATFAGRDGGKLRTREAPIHADATPPACTSAG